VGDGSTRRLGGIDAVHGTTGHLRERGPYERGAYPGTVPNSYAAYGAGSGNFYAAQPPTPGFASPQPAMAGFPSAGFPPAVPPGGAGFTSSGYFPSSQGAFLPPRQSACSLYA
jgi:hypothetical protein